MTRDNSIFILGAVLLGVLLVGAGIVIAGIAPGITTAQLDTDTQNDSPRLIGVTASGTVEGEPDAAVIRLSVEATADDPSTARSLVAEDATQMRSALLDSGLSEDQIRSVDFRVFEDRQPRPEDRSSEDVQYRARHAYEIELDDIDAVGSVIDTAIDNGATSVHDVRFTLSDDTQRDLKEQALSNAMTNARTNADVIATNGDVTITRMYSANTGDIHYPVHRVAAESLASGDSAQTSLDPGPVSVTATVTVQYEIT